MPSPVRTQPKLPPIPDNHEHESDCSPQINNRFSEIELVAVNDTLENFCFRTMKEEIDLRILNAANPSTHFSLILLTGSLLAILQCSWNEMRSKLFALVQLQPMNDNCNVKLLDRRRHRCLLLAVGPARRPGIVKRLALRKLRQLENKDDISSCSLLAGPAYARADRDTRGP